MEFRLLGQVGVSAGGLPVEIGSPQQRLLVAALAADAGRLVTVECLIGRVWDDAPDGARRTLHVLVSRLRRVLAAVAVVGERPGVLIRTLSAVGRPADALAHYAQVRQRLAEELGVSPGPGMQAACQAVRGGGGAGAGAGPGPLLSAAEPAAAGSVQAGPAPSPSRQAEPAAAGPVHAVPSLARQAVPYQLPAAPRPFTGRGGELAALTAALAGAGAGAQEPGVICVVRGIAGVGKTWLALRWAHEHADRFPDGNLWVSLRGFDPCGPPVDAGTALRALLEALGVRAGEIPAGEQAQSGLYRSLTAGKRILVILDNARDTSQVVPLLPGSAGCMTLVTGRSRLAGLVTGHGAVTLDLDVLSAGQARDLLACRVGAGRLAAEPAAAADLVAFCAGLPLAISVAAAQAAAHPGFSLAALAADLADGATRLDGLDAGDAPASVRSVLSCSYRALDAPAATVFALLGLAPGPDISLAAAASLAGLPARRARAVLLELENTCLVHQHMPGRYRMHDLIALYALEQARRGQPADARTHAQLRVADYYLHTAVSGERMLSPQQRYPLSPGEPAAGCTPHPLPAAAAALAWFGAEYPCLLAAQRLAAAHGWHTHVWQLAWATNTFHKFQGSLHNWADMWQAGVAAADSLGQPAIQALTRSCLARALSRLGRYDEALTHLNEAVRLAELAGDATALAQTESTLSQLRQQEGNYQRAVTHSARALRLFRTLGLPVWEAIELCALGWHHAHLGNLTAARAACHAALSLLGQHEDRHGEADTTDTLGYIAVRAGDYAQALRYYDRALRLWRDLGHSHGEADSLAGLAIAYAASGEHAKASTMSRQALELFQAQHRTSDAGNLQCQLKSYQLPQSNRL